MYVMQHIERLAKIVFDIKMDNLNEGFFSGIQVHSIKGSL